MPGGVYLITAGGKFRGPGEPWKQSAGDCDYRFNNLSAARLAADATRKEEVDGGEP